MPYFEALQLDGLDQPAPQDVQALLDALHATFRQADPNPGEFIAHDIIRAAIDQQLHTGLTGFERLADLVEAHKTAVGSQIEEQFRQLVPDFTRGTTLDFRWNSRSDEIDCKTSSGWTAYLRSWRNKQPRNLLCVGYDDPGDYAVFLWRGTPSDLTGAVNGDKKHSIPLKPTTPNLHVVLTGTVPPSAAAQLRRNTGLTVGEISQLPPPQRLQTITSALRAGLTLDRGALDASGMPVELLVTVTSGLLFGALADHRDTARRHGIRLRPGQVCLTPGA